MLQEDHITKLLGIANVSVKDVEETAEEMRIYLETPISFQICPVCHKKTKNVHDYRRQRIRDLAVNNKPSVLILRKRRCHCPCCGKNFYERYEFLPRYAHRTKRVTAPVIRSLEEKVSCKETARCRSLSSSTVLRLSECRNISHGDTLPEVLGIDKCKGNAGGEKYQCIPTDIEKRYIMDILPDRRKIQDNEISVGEMVK